MSDSTVAVVTHKNRRAGMTRGRRHRIWISTLSLTLALACSGDGIPAPTVRSPGLAGPCGTLAGISQVTRRAIDGGRFDAIGRLLKTHLVETGQYRPLFHVAIAMLRQAPLPEMMDALADLMTAGETLAMIPAVFDVVDYITGRSAHVEGEHYELSTVGERVFRYCDARADFATLRRLLELDLPCSGCANGRAPFTPLMMRSLAELLNDPVFVTFLDDFQLDQDGQTIVGLEAYVQLGDLILQNFASSSFDWSYVRGLLDDMVGSLLTGQTRLRFAALLDLVAHAVDPSSGLLPDLQTFVGCLYRNDDNHALAELSYNFALSEQLEMGDLLRVAADTYESEPGTRLLAQVAIIFGMFEHDDRLAREFLGSVSPMLGEASARELLPAISDLRAQGVATELADALEAFVSGCKHEAPQ